MPSRYPSCCGFDAFDADNAAILTLRDLRQHHRPTTNLDLKALRVLHHAALVCAGYIFSDEP
jgi:hypothetical protein